MKKVSKILAVLLSVCLLFSLTTVTAWGAGAQPSSEYTRPDTNIAEMVTKPRIDGELESGAWANQATKIEFTESALKKSGLIWTHSEDSLIYEPLPDVSGTAYLGYDSNYLYFALEVNQAEHVNDQSDNNLLWMGDCVQIQIGPDANLIASDTDPGTCNRYELGFALSTFTKGRRLGYKWFPEPGENLKSGAKQDMSKADGDFYYYVERTGTKTVYEIALKYSFFGRSEPLEKGDVIPFSFALHINEPNPVSDTDNGSFMEWAQGVVGGTLEKNIASAARLTLGVDGPVTPPVGSGDNPTTAKKPTTTTAKNPDGGNTDNKTTAGGNTDNKTTAGGNTDSKTTAGGNTDSTTTAPVATQPGETTTTTEATTTTAPTIEGVEEFYSDDKATDVEDTAILDEIKKDFADKDVIVKSYVPEKKKFGISVDALEGIYVKNADGTYTVIEGEEEDIEGEDGSITTWLVYDVSTLEEGQSLYVVKTAPATTTEATTTTAAATTTEPADGADATTTAPADDEGKGKEGGSNWWIWLLIALAVIVIAIILFIILKKKKDDEEEEEETEAPAEE